MRRTARCCLAWAAIAAAVVVVGGVIGVAAHSGVDDTSVAIDTPSEGGAPTTASAEALDAEPTATSAAPTASGSTNVPIRNSITPVAASDVNITAFGPTRSVSLPPSAIPAIAPPPYAAR